LTDIKQLVKKSLNQFNGNDLIGRCSASCFFDCAFYPPLYAHKRT